MAVQLGFDLPARAALGRDDFMVAPSNAVALAMIDNWPSWPLAKLALTGPLGSGKSHLTHVWASEAGARIVMAMDLAEQDIDALAQHPVAVEGVDTIRADMTAQTALFHLHNLLHSAALPLLMTGVAAPNLWRLSLPDLQSRVDAAAHAALDAPDDTLLGAVLAKLFADRQLTPRPDVIPYLVTHMERSFAAARDIVATLDATSLARKRPITRSLAAELLDKDTTSGG
ncbi:chromosomal replication initiator DnaA [uncultured Tateyamaria sp.]|uniref:chromosomal replication initiator DnaA n=1 Tax=uncultured Tateyamaria sp. TaxID=455651 RepID=UPI00262C4AA5|nr:chromosomal replication initiator DnaA [uncultured Tateyamaria sp.]